MKITNTFEGFITVEEGAKFCKHSVVIYGYLFPGSYSVKSDNRRESSIYKAKPFWADDICHLQLPVIMPRAGNPTPLPAAVPDLATCHNTCPLTLSLIEPWSLKTATRTITSTPFKPGTSILFLNLRKIEL